MDLDTLGGRGQRKGAVRDLEGYNSSGSESSEPKEKIYHHGEEAKEKIIYSGEDQEFKEEEDDDEKGIKIEAFNLKEEMQEGY